VEFSIIRWGVEMPLYTFKNNQITRQVKQSAFATERELQRLFEQNLEVLLGVRFIGSEFTTGDRQRGRIDTLGLDEDNSPTIIEYKKNNKENVINQGLFYLDWLVDHKGDFTVAVQKKLGNSNVIDWSHPRLILIAETFSEYDKFAVNRIGANIELWTYIKYDDDLLYIDPIYVPETVQRKVPVKPSLKVEGSIPLPQTTEEPFFTIEDHTKGKPDNVLQLFSMVQEGIFLLAGENEIAEKANKHYICYKHGKNFVEVQLQTTGLKIWLDVTFHELQDKFDLTRDVSKIGHYGTGNVEVRFTKVEDFGKVMRLIQQSYQATV
jgi:predicted transport protein